MFGVLTVMPVYCCRWPNGDVSFVTARNREDAVIALDEIGNAETADIFGLRNFMLHLRLEDDGQLTFQEFGEETGYKVRQKAYPILNKLEESATESASEISKAVEQERKRLKGRKAIEPETLLGKRLKTELDLPTVVVNKIVRDEAKKRLQNLKIKGKPQ